MGRAERSNLTLDGTMPLPSWGHHGAGSHSGSSSTPATPTGLEGATAPPAVEAKETHSLPRTRGGSQKRSTGSKYAARLSGGSFKGRFSNHSHGSTSKEKEEGSGSGHSPRSSLNHRIAHGASNFQSYASRYIESIRPKSWGRSSTNSSNNSLGLPPSGSGSGRSGGSSRSESPNPANLPPATEGPGTPVPHLLTFRSPPASATPSPRRLSPRPPSGKTKEAGNTPEKSPNFKDRLRPVKSPAKPVERESP